MSELFQPFGRWQAADYRLDSSFIEAAGLIFSLLQLN